MATTPAAALAGVTASKVTTAFGPSWQLALRQLAWRLKSKTPVCSRSDLLRMGPMRVAGPACGDPPKSGFLAVTFGLRAGATLAQSAQSGTAAVEAYEAHSRTRLHTDHRCAFETLQFLPLVAEACSGGWGPTATATLRALGGLIAARSGHSRLSVALQRENARAVLCRLPVEADLQSTFAEP